MKARQANPPLRVYGRKSGLRDLGRGTERSLRMQAWRHPVGRP